MASISDRAAIKRKIVEVLTNYGPGAMAAGAAGETPLVTYNDPTPDQLDHNEFVIVGRITGDLKAVTIGNSQTGVNDTFTIECFVGVAQQGSSEALADARCELILNSIQATLFESPRLERSGTEPSMREPGLYPGRLDGPNSSPTDGTAALSAAFFNIDVQVSLRGS